MDPGSAPSLGLARLALPGSGWGRPGCPVQEEGCWKEGKGWGWVGGGHSVGVLGTWGQERSDWFLLVPWWLQTAPPPPIPACFLPTVLDAGLSTEAGGCSGHPSAAPSCPPPPGARTLLPNALRESAGGIAANRDTLTHLPHAPGSNQGLSIHLIGLPQPGTTDWVV